MTRIEDENDLAAFESASSAQSAALISSNMKLTTTFLYEAQRVLLQKW
jgi:hypothetical protein